ncbi:aryl-sulfate sulfotransferase [Myxococcota bacterium]
MDRQILQILAVFALTACGTVEIPPTQVDIIRQVQIWENPRNSLSAVVVIETFEPCRVQVEFSSDKTSTQRTGLSAHGTEHEITVVGLRSETIYHLQPIVLTDAGDELPGERSEFATGKLAEGIPELEVVVHDPDLLQPGVTIFGPSRMGSEGNETWPLYLGVDQSGEVVWYYEDATNNSRTTATRDVKMLPDGNLLIGVAGGFRVITIGGDTVAEVTGHFHHDGVGLPESGYITLTQQTQEVYSPSLGTVQARGDVIVELDEQGETTWTWSMFDHLDTSRFPTGLSNTRGENGTYDWTHSNAVVYCQQDQSILASVRHQNWVIKVDRKTGALLWRFGVGGDFQLTNLDPATGNTWFFSQHAPQPGPDNTMLIYDNGNDRPGPPQASHKFSRAVMYRLDEQQLLAEQIWQYQTDFYTHFVGDADFLANGNVLVCAGGPGEEAPAVITEVTGETPARKVWELRADGLVIYRATRLPSFWLD